MSDEGLAVARRVGDPDTLSYVLARRAHSLWVPELLEERLANTAENVALTERLARSDDRFWAAMYRLAAVVTAGQGNEIDHHLATMREVADNVGLPLLRWECTNQHSWRALLQGRIDDAEAGAFRGLAEGDAADQPDVGVVFAAAMFLVRYDQGRLAEIVDIVEQTVRDNPGIPGLRATLAIAMCELGREDEALLLLLEECGHALRRRALRPVLDRDPHAVVPGRRPSPGRGTGEDAPGTAGAVEHPGRIHRRARVRCGRARARAHRRCDGRLRRRRTPLRRRAGDVPRPRRAGVGGTRATRVGRRADRASTATATRPGRRSSSTTRWLRRNSSAPAASSSGPPPCERGCRDVRRSRRRNGDGGSVGVEDVDDEHEGVGALDARAARALRAVALVGGTTSSTCEPTVWPTRPLSQPGMTWPLPITKSAG